jgi:serine phosphatase RsbU (regulator of sigma subunit)
MISCFRARQAPILLLVLLTWPGSSVSAAEDEVRSEVVEIDEECLVYPVTLVRAWRFRPGDDSAWADPELDDSKWALVEPNLRRPEEIPGGWHGIGWFRRRIRTTEAFGELPLGLHILQAGASEIYLDGEKVAGFGTVSESAEDEVPMVPRYVASMTLEPGVEHLLAVRYSNSTGNVLGRGFRGFHLTLGELQSLTARGIRMFRWEAALEGLIIGIFGAFAVLHLLLFVFRPRTSENLLFALFAGLMVAFLVIDLKTNSLSELTTALRYFKILLSLSLAVALSALLLELRVLKHRVGPIFYVLAGASLLVALWVWTRPVFSEILPVVVVGGLIYLETLRVAISALLRREPEAWVLAGGFLCLTAVFLISILVNLGWLQAPMLEIFVAGLALLALSFSVYLTRAVARTSRALEGKLAEVEALTEKTVEQERRAAREEAERRVLESDNRRKTAELEDARRLQLALLPHEIPNPEGFEIAVHMTTANEVGGDYYDFAANGDGTLTLAVGDATGHGLTAGMVVAVVKSLFQAACREPSLATALQRIGLGLQQMRLRLASMAMLLARLGAGRLRFASAGMPPILVWRSGSGRVEEVLLPGVPLGTLPDASFDEREIQFEPGDTALIMTDGLAEVTGPGGEMVGYDLAGSWFADAAALDASEVIARLAGQAREFLAGNPLPDDMTLVVLKARS